ncbi:protein of unknown function [Litoreibacter ascidiaceicola]|uniref:YjiS-like domain-containing protein n=1 Tax=Litoreibacter ascidiaceicola TaxID=1486859 RepID=A0A1M5EN33_9RHOB|nr:DUF1127 domain-containing protein [Litoreibacter ascidiaceicola]SHF80703.1 protein of unknown function [Litoreibacter ascidiaceicola]
MAYATSIRTAPTLIERLVAFKNDLAERHAKNRLYRQTLDELQVLSNRELADLGMNRANLKSIAHEAAYGN